MSGTSTIDLARASVGPGIARQLESAGRFGGVAVTAKDGDVAAALAAVDEAFAGRFFNVARLADPDETEPISEAISYEATGTVLFGAITALAAAAFVGQAVSRQSRREWRDGATLRALGMSRQQAGLAALGRARHRDDRGRGGDRCMSHAVVDRALRRRRPRRDRARRVRRPAGPGARGGRRRRRRDPGHVGTRHPPVPPGAARVVHGGPAGPAGAAGPPPGARRRRLEHVGERPRRRRIADRHSPGRRRPHVRHGARRRRPDRQPRRPGRHASQLRRALGCVGQRRLRRPARGRRRARDGAHRPTCGRRRWAGGDGRHDRRRDRLGPGLRDRRGDQRVHRARHHERTGTGGDRRDRAGHSDHGVPGACRSATRSPCGRPRRTRRSPVR